MYSIIMSSTAKRDIDNISNFCSNVSTTYAKKVRYNIHLSINSLLNFPKGYSIYVFYEDTTFRKQVSIKRYLIVFSVFEDYIFIHKIFDGRQNFNPISLIINNI